MFSARSASTYPTGSVGPVLARPGIGRGCSECNPAPDLRRRARGRDPRHRPSTSRPCGHSGPRQTQAPAHGGGATRPRRHLAQRGEPSSSGASMPRGVPGQCVSGHGSTVPSAEDRSIRFRGLSQTRVFERLAQHRFRARRWRQCSTHDGNSACPLLGAPNQVASTVWHRPIQKSAPTYHGSSFGLGVPRTSRSMFGALPSSAARALSNRSASSSRRAPTQ
jgi:hypothetical protein